MIAGRRSAKCRGSALAAMIAIAMGSPLEAQTTAGSTSAVVRGRIVDSSTGTPVRGAAVRQEQSGSLAVSDSFGGFALDIVDASSPIVVTVEHLGYWSLSFDLPTGFQSRSIRVELVPRALSLSEIRVPILSEESVRYEKGLARTEAGLRTRRGFSGSRVRVIDQQTMLESETASVGRFLWHRSPHWTLCQSSASSYCVSRNGRQRPVVVCIDEVYAFDGVRALEGMSPEKLYMVEIYGLLGSEVRAYTTAFMDRAARRGGIALRPWKFMKSPC